MDISAVELENIENEESMFSRSYASKSQEKLMASIVYKRLVTMKHENLQIKKAEQIQEDAEIEKLENQLSSYHSNLISWKNEIDKLIPKLEQLEEKKSGRKPFSTLQNFNSYVNEANFSH